MSRLTEMQVASLLSYGERRLLVPNLFCLIAIRLAHMRIRNCRIYLISYSLTMMGDSIQLVIVDKNYYKRYI